MGKKISTNFKKESIPNINKVLNFVLSNKYSDFYQEKYQGNAIKLSSYEEFKQIPFLVKDDFLKIDLDKRTFVPKEEISYYSISSGTSTNKKPSVIPHSSFYHDSLEKFQFNKDFFEKIGVATILSLLPPMSSLSFRAATIPSKPAKIILGDLHNIQATAFISNELKINGILTTITAIEILIPELKRIGFEFENIKWISLGGETCSTLRLAYLKELFPMAYFYMRFGNSEIGGSRHYQCPYLHEKAPNIFHIDSESELIEIINDDGNLVDFEESGEIVHTDLKKKAFPLIRYKTRDIGYLKEINCPCGEKIALVVDGKSGTDNLKIFGTTLKSELISEAIFDVVDFVEPRFQLHVFEEKTSFGIKPLLEINLKLKKDKININDESYLGEILCQKISSKLKIAPNKSLADMVEEGFYLPLKIKFVENWPIESKSKSIISHI